MKNRIIILALALAGCLATGRAQITVSWGNDAETRVFANSTGALLPVGSALSLGTFAAGTDFSSTSYSYLSSQFTQFGTAKIGDGGYDVPGFFVAGVTPQAPLSTKLYIWSFNAATAATATEWGIFSNSGSVWTTPGTAPDILIMDIVQANVANAGKLTATMAQTSPIPEPATYAAILGFVVLGVVGYRRFRR